MSTELLAAVDKLSPEKQRKLEVFIEYLSDDNRYTEVDAETVAHRLKNMGLGRGQIWIADDFDDTPEDFKDYI